MRNLFAKNKFEATINAAEDTIKKTSRKATREMKKLEKDAVKKASKVTSDIDDVTDDLLGTVIGAGVLGTVIGFAPSIAIVGGVKATNMVVNKIRKNAKIERLARVADEGGDSKKTKKVCDRLDYIPDMITTEKEYKYLVKAIVVLSENGALDGVITSIAYQSFARCFKACQKGYKTRLDEMMNSFDTKDKVREFYEEFKDHGMYEFPLGTFNEKMEGVRLVRTYEEIVRRIEDESDTEFLDAYNDLSILLQFTAEENGKTRKAIGSINAEYLIEKYGEYIDTAEAVYDDTLERNPGYVYVPTWNMSADKANTKTKAMDPAEEIKKKISDLTQTAYNIQADIVRETDEKKLRRLNRKLSTIRTDIIKMNDKYIKMLEKNGHDTSDLRGQSVMSPDEVVDDADADYDQNVFTDPDTAYDEAVGILRDGYNVALEIAACPDTAVHAYNALIKATDAAKKMLKDTAFDPSDMKKVEGFYPMLDYSSNVYLQQVSNKVDDTWKVCIWKSLNHVYMDYIAKEDKTTVIKRITERKDNLIGRVNGIFTVDKLKSRYTKMVEDEFARVVEKVNHHVPYNKDKADLQQKLTDEFDQLQDTIDDVLKSIRNGAIELSVAKPISDKAAEIMELVNNDLLTDDEKSDYTETLNDRVAHQMRRVVKYLGMSWKEYTRELCNNRLLSVEMGELTQGQAIANIDNVFNHIYDMLDTAYKADDADGQALKTKLEYDRTTWVNLISQYTNVKKGDAFKKELSPTATGKLDARYAESLNAIRHTKKYDKAQNAVTRFEEDLKKACSDEQAAPGKFEGKLEELRTAVEKRFPELASTTAATVEGGKN